MPEGGPVAPVGAPERCALDGAWTADFGVYEGRVEIAGDRARLVGKAAREVPLRRDGARLEVGGEACVIAAGTDRCTEVACPGPTMPKRWWR